MNKSKVLSQISYVYEKMQNLQLQPTKYNVVILADSLLKLEEIYKAVSSIPEEEKEGTEDV